MTRPRLLHLTTTAISLDWLLAPQLHAFEAAGFDVITASGGGPHVSSLEQQGIRHIEIPSFSRQFDLATDRQAMNELRVLFDDVRPDIVHTHNPKPGIMGRVQARRSKVPIVINTVHGLYAQPTDSIARRTAVYSLERLAARCSDAELVQSPEDVETLLRIGVPHSRVHLLGNGIDLDRFGDVERRVEQRAHLRREFDIAPGVPVVGMVGRMVWEKGYRELFDAVEVLRHRGVTFEVVVVGPGEPGVSGAVDQPTIDRMSDVGVRFLGSRRDVDHLLSLFDVFTLPSHREGFPRAAMEASASGLPVVASDIRGCRQVVRHNETGLLVAPRSGVALADALEQLLTNPAQRSQFGSAASRFAAAEFDQQRVISRTLAVYRQQLRRAGIACPAESWSTEGLSSGTLSVDDDAQRRTSSYSSSIDLVAVDASNRRAESAAA